MVWRWRGTRGIYKGDKNDAKIALNSGSENLAPDGDGGNSNLAL